MSNTFFIGDTHFGHSKPYTTFMLEDGCTLLRPHGSADAGDEAMVENWNRVVGVNDTVYHLGDIVINKKHLYILYRLNGRKKLIQGNHDKENAAEYLKYFTNVQGIAEVDKFALSHVPLHRAGISRWEANIHGHLHDKIVRREARFDRDSTIDSKYFCVSVEQINYTPISIEEVKQRIKLNKEKYGE